ncbi:hypothetical protein NQ318_002225 [Aromia moschata]|uniref:Cyclic nucleotide-binding domain-containing protein n=1 Tax=Aromia moschata TaxID=1265417 RepID=A0AAV8Z5D6_9CUCU|nr:hypothetical protein NQ318_002225 [Aromia moschata]
MSNVHDCNLPPKDTSGFSKLPPNASPFRKLARGLRKQLAVNPNNFKCKEFFRNKSCQTAEQKRYAQSAHFYVIHPFSNLNSLLEVVFFLTWFACIVSDPLEILTDLGPVSSVYDMIDDIIIINIQRILVVSFFFVGYVDTKTKEIVTQPQRVIWNYLTTYFIFDATATGLTLQTIKLIFLANTSREGEVIFTICKKIIGMCAFLTRLDTLMHFLKHITRYLRLPKGIQTAATYILRTFIYIHCLTCFMYGVPSALYIDDWPQESWMRQAQIHRDSDTTLLSRYMECLLVIVCYFFGASHGLYNVNMPNEQLYLTIVTLFGRLYTLFLLADLLKNFGIAGVAESKYEQQLSTLEEYMLSKDLPSNLRKRLLQFYEYKLQKHYFNEPEIMSTLSEHLRTELFLFAARKLIRKVHVFKCLPKATLGAIIASMKMETYSPRDVIIKIGTNIENLFFISSGTVAVINGEGLELLHMEDGEEFGIISTFTDLKQKYQIETVEPTEVFYINKDVFLGLLSTHPEAIKKFHESIEKRASKLLMIEETIKKGGVGFLSELRSGKILESLNKRPTVEK